MSTAVRGATILSLATVWLHWAALCADFGASPAQKKSPATLGGATSSRKAEGMGFEPDADFAATGVLPCGCVICPECRAALALQTGRPEWHELASFDVDLQRVIAAWEGLPEGIRKAVMAVVESSR